eukprot:m.226134 g.226134  ORF g.226134 m.226134 type:complete len:89 (-) comp13863_c5_seq4:4823-5089(-)
MNVRLNYLLKSSHSTQSKYYSLKYTINTPKSFYSQDHLKNMAAYVCFSLSECSYAFSTAEAKVAIHFVAFDSLSAQNHSSCTYPLFVP